jgi:hypothetical protein
MNAKITNIVLDKDRFKVFVSFSNGANDIFSFMSDATSEIIKEEILIKKEYYEGLEQKELDLNNELQGEEF